MAYETFEKIEGIIRSIDRGDSCCSMMIAIITDNGIVNAVVTGETRIIDHVRLRTGMRVAVFYDTNLPVPAVYPSRYQAELVTLLRRGQQVMLDYFDSELTSADGSLKLNIGMTTDVVTENGQPYICTPENTEMLVYYTTTTFSIPAQTTPQKIVVLCQY